MLQMSNLYRVQLILGKAKEQDMHAECAILYGKVIAFILYQTKIQSPLAVWKSNFFPNYWYLKVNFLVPENLLWDTSGLR